jgi:hypothetical protein
VIAELEAKALRRDLEFGGDDRAERRDARSGEVLVGYDI